MELIPVQEDGSDKQMETGAQEVYNEKGDLCFKKKKVTKNMHAILS